MLASISRSYFGEQFLRSIGLAVTNDIFIRLRRGNSLKHHKERKKIAIDDSRKLALGRCAVHLLPVSVSVLILAINLRQVFIGIDFESAIRSETINLALLQTAAKLQELLIVASLAAVTFQLLRYELLYGDGLPLGLLAAGFEFTKLSFLWSPETLGTLTDTFTRARSIRRFALLLFLLTAGALATLAGPACAVLLIPTSQDWPAGTQHALLPGTQEQIWPARLLGNKTNTSEICSSTDATKYGICPSGGYYSLWAHYGQIDMNDYELVVPNYAKRLSGNHYYWPLNSAPPISTSTISLGILGSKSSTFIQPKIGVAVVLDRLMQAWWDKLQSERGFVEENVDDRAAVAHVLSAMSTVTCSMAHNLSRSDRIVPFPDTNSPDSSIDRNLSQSLGNDDPSEHVRLSWVPPIDGDDWTSTSAVFQSPWTSDNQSRVAVGCNIQAQWVPTQVLTDGYSFWQGWYPKNISFEQAIPSTGHAVIIDSTAYSKRNAISIDEDWLSILTPTIGKGQPGYRDWAPTTIEGILNSVPLMDGLQDTGDISLVDAWNEDPQRKKLLTSIIGSIFNDGLARIDIENVFDQSGSPSAWTPLNPLSPSTSHRRSKAPSRRAIDDTDDLNKIHLDFSISGFSYRLTLVQKLAMVVLLVHISIATAHIIWLLWKHESSGCWDSIIELLVLAQNSDPAFSALGNTAAGIKSSRSFATRVVIRATKTPGAIEADHLEMVYPAEEATKRDNEMVNLERDPRYPVDSHPEGRRISHPSTWPVRRHHSEASANESLDQQTSYIETDIGTPLIGSTTATSFNCRSSGRVQVGHAYG
ncbi:MAG: hypothetical protein Q9174_003489 [Haloplaca sp. 1 TL-2023]